jgi:adenylosuccinate lyase
MLVHRFKSTCRRFQHDVARYQNIINATNVAPILNQSLRSFSSTKLNQAQSTLSLSSLTAISGVDGRYARQTSDLRAYFSEYALIKYRVLVEIEWLKFMAATPDIPEVSKLSPKSIEFLDNIVTSFSESDAQAVKNIEAVTNHDVKAVEYFLKEKFAQNSELSSVSEFLHFACTSEDINNLAYAKMFHDASIQVIIPSMKSLISTVSKLANDYSSISMLARTHGQAATPTTMGKEFANVVYRLERQLTYFQNIIPLGKFNGAVGNFNAHLVAYPSLDWPSISRSFVKSLGIEYNPYTTQIEPHDWIAESFDAVSRFNTVLIDFNRDIWGYISIGYFKQKVVKNEVGSSTMPHKVNPIDFENSEGNLGISNAIMGHLSEKLPISRFQRDLSDSTVMRNIGLGFSYSLIAYKSLLKGLGKLQIDETFMRNELDHHYEVLAEPIQTVMRKFNVPKPYEQLKELTRGHTTMNSNVVNSFLQKLADKKELPVDVVEALKQLTPEKYVGLAKDLAIGIEKETKKKH